MNFRIEFWNPWLLLLLIPALLFALIPYFRLNKKYRKTRNRIASIVLHILVMVLSISVLAGITFTYQITNEENEIILLVDVSDTQKEAEDAREDFILTLLNESGYDGYRVGIVTFGFTQNYAVSMTDDIDSIYSTYVNADLPDTSATDIAAALTYTSTLFNYPETAKIVLITDGKQTDENATAVIGSIVAQGIKVDTAYIPSEYAGDHVQVLGVEFPETHISVGDQVSLGVTVLTKTTTESTTIELRDNGELDSENGIVQIPLGVGSQTIPINNIFTTEGLHEIEIRVIENGDSLEENNEFCTYIYIEVYNKVLVLEHFEGSSKELDTLLDPDYEVTVVNFRTSPLEDIPVSVEQLREYDQVILNNIANEDLPVGFDEILYSYVYDYGGGLFTVGGCEPNSDDAHAYNRLDMNNSLYQRMLPVEAINYTPPVGVIVIIDISGSMTGDGTDGITKLEWAKQGAIACLDALTERDYIGIMTLDTVYGTVLQPTPRTQETLIKEAIMSIESGGSTNFTGAIERAGQALAGLENVDRRHIILVTDGMPGDPAEKYLPVVEENYRVHEITISAVGIDVSENSKAYETLFEITELGYGKLHVLTDESKLVPEMREDLNAPEIKEVNPEPFYPIVNNESSNILRGVEFGRTEEGGSRKEMGVQLGGFFGTRARASADLVLTGEFDIPIYAQWKFGKGTVGSFMSDLNGKWSSDFMSDDNGKKFLLNVVTNLMPTENIRVTEINIDLREENYINQLSVYTDLEDGQSIRGEIVAIDASGAETGTVVSLNELKSTEPGYYVTLNLSEGNNYSRCNFVVKERGTYLIRLIKCDASGKEIARLETYKSFAYSQEYVDDPEDTEFTPEMLLEELANRGNGVMVEDLKNPWEIFESFITALPRTFDPRWLFMIMAMVFFLMDIAVRKFKFKWPHEIIREYKQKQAEKKSSR
ncbi:MAG: VWA domain-containing protein [Clostridia bacterium]|nr:VWA domain-containing protein [Clostridia bacterium]